MDTVLIHRVLEAAILAADSPLDRDTMLSLFDEAERPDRDTLNQILAQLAENYADRGIELKEVASGFRFQVRREMGPWVSRLWQEKSPRYSRAILETLALIAYRQPITRGEIEEIRGVAVNTQIVKTMLERNWIRIVGHRDVPGRPAMFATTRQFLDYFDLKSLEDLPTLSEIRDLDKINEELELEEKLTAPRGEDPEADQGDAPRQTTIMDAINSEPEIDESTLMSLEQVDSVLAGFEAEFRRKPADQDVEPDSDSAPEADVDAEAEDSAQEHIQEPSDTELFPDIDAQDVSSEDDADDAGAKTKHE
ncbi:MAG: SMC-Scp complex subunit ScpB [Gammaproteobacteria bacterium HGW-Gammaproteobacteria-14]|nr:MAG: SMC-Scp complex subunit ScpB [Gammaproteobacteria bacterium HGW-Gammaproteobacteria-14]